MLFYMTEIQFNALQLEFRVRAIHFFVKTCFVSRTLEQYNNIIINNNNIVGLRRRARLYVDDMLTFPVYPLYCVCYNYFCIFRTG